MNAYDELSDAARQLMAEYDGLAIADMCATAQAERNKLAAGASLICSDERHQAKVSALEAELAALRAGEEPHEDDRVVPTPAQWIWRWNRAAPERRLQVAEGVAAAADHFYQCFMNAWPDRARDAEAQLAAARARIAELERHALRENGPRTDSATASDAFTVRQTGPVQEVAAEPGTLHRLRQRYFEAPAERLGVNVGQVGAFFGFSLVTDAALPPGEVHMRPRKVRTACPPSCADGHMYDGDCLIDPHDGTGAIGRSSFPGETGWYFSCDGEGGCEGLVSHGHTSDAAARRALDRHIKQKHGPERSTAAAIDQTYCYDPEAGQ